MNPRTFLHRYAFLLVAACLVLFQCIHLYKGAWAGDFWDHAAVVRELEKDLLHPKNPIISADIPHAFFSPYALTVAAFSRTAQLHPLAALAWAGFFNLLFFLAAFQLFCRSVCKEDHRWVAALGLLFVLLFWGLDPPRWSGFYHLLTLHYVLPYPSTFAMAISLLVLSCMATARPRYMIVRYAFLVVSTALVLITHPTTGLFLCLGMVALHAALDRDSIPQCIWKTSVVALPALLLCLAWPYFSFLHLFTGNSADFHQDSRELYQGVLQNGWPLLLLLPGAFLFRRHRVMQFFSVFLLLLMTIYAIGYFAKLYGVSRLFANLMMVAQIAMAFVVVKLWREKHPVSKPYTALLFFALVSCMLVNRAALAGTLHVFRPQGRPYHDRYRFLEKMVPSEALVLSDLTSSSFIPAFHGKVIATKHPLYWVDDLPQRRKDVQQFFTAELPDTVRSAILQRYSPGYILVDHLNVALPTTTLHWLRSRGKTLYFQDNLELIILADE